MHLPRAEPAVRLLHHVVPTCPLLRASPRSMLLQGTGPALLPANPSSPTMASGPTPRGIVAAANFAIKTLCQSLYLSPGLELVPVGYAQAWALG